MCRVSNVLETWLSSCGDRLGTEAPQKNGNLKENITTDEPRMLDLPVACAHIVSFCRPRIDSVSQAAATCEVKRVGGRLTF